LILLFSKLAAFRISEDWKATKEAAGYIMEYSREVEVRPFASHERGSSYERISNKV
jgi:hypothetical protein